MKIKQLLCTVLLFYSSFARSQVPPVLTPEQLQADFTRFRTALQEAHPAPYRYTPKGTFDSLLAATQARLNRPMSQQEFYVAMVPLLVALRDGHIKWIVAGQDQHYPFHSDTLFPLKLYFLQDKAWVVGSYGAETVPTGAEVRAINGRSMATIIEKLLAYITYADGATINGKYEDLNHFFSGYYATFFGAPANFDITYRTAHTDTTVRMASVTLETIKKYEGTLPAVPQNARLTFEDSTKVARLTISRFWTEKDEPSYKKFLAQAFQEIKARNCNSLILDLRDNEGGEEKYGIKLYQYLAQHPFRYYDRIGVRQKKALSFPAYTPKLYRLLRGLVVKKRGEGYVFTAQRGLKTLKPARHAFAGKLYVLINGGSFSVSTEFAARVHADRRGTFIGQETSGAYEGNNSGIFAITQLPHSKIDLGVPLFGFHMANLPVDLQKGQGIRPDYVVIPTIEDVIAGNDPALQVVRQLISTK